MLALLLLVTALCWYGMFRWQRRRLYELAALIPGSPEFPLIGHAHKFLGSTQRITNPVDLEFVPKTCLEKDDVHRFIRATTGNGGIFAPVSIWRPRRKIMAPTFSPRILEQFVEIFAEQSDILSRRLAAQSDGAPLSAWALISAYTLDSVCDPSLILDFGSGLVFDSDPGPVLVSAPRRAFNSDSATNRSTDFKEAGESTMGVKIGAQKNGKNPFVVSLNRVMQCICNRMFHLWLHPNWLYRLFPEYQEFKTNTKIVHDFTDQFSRYKQKPEKRELCFLSRRRFVSHSRGPQGITVQTTLQRPHKLFGLIDDF
ncbi:Cytochrome P450 4d2 [Eumeta japonica]|uniref:Cytochrome P450 4d2 n=1 Tax=Eumeta variegata TaxID=151549 RepID=A0A4C1V3S7_EUMVA|nr:Cytochrome P450 4d2 [Eumeta japonica]